MKYWRAPKEVGFCRTPWLLGESCACAGWIILDQKIYRGSELVALIDRQDSIPLGEIEAGEFALVKQSGMSCEVVVDPISSIPVFYTKEPSFKLSPSAANLRLDEEGERQLNTKAEVAGFLASGMTLGSDTLLPGVSRVQAGEHLRFNEGVVSRENWFQIPRCISNPKNQKDADSAYEEAKENATQSLYRAFNISISTLDRETVWIPLSGGMDSRLIAFLFKELGYQRVKCYSYGRRNSFESQRSKQVADLLGLDWHFVDYSAKNWRSWFSSEAYQDYRRWSFNYTAIEHEQDWPAVAELQKRGLLEDDSVFVPGHAMDFLAGSHLPSSGPLNGTDLLRSKYFNLMPRVMLDSSLDGLIDSLLDKYQLGMGIPAERQFDFFGWRERQSKMIANSVRVYEHHGYSWRLPFWDKSLAEFWLGLGTELRLDKKLYLDVCRDMMPKELADIPATPPRSSKPSRVANRLVDRDYSRQAMFSESGFIKSFPTQSIQSELGALPDELRKLFVEVKNWPLVRIPFNGQLALFQIIDLYRGR